MRSPSQLEARAALLRSGMIVRSRTLHFDFKNRILKLISGVRAHHQHHRHHPRPIRTKTVEYFPLMVLSNDVLWMKKKKLLTMAELAVVCYHHDYTYLFRFVFLSKHKHVTYNSYSFFISHIALYMMMSECLSCSQSQPLFLASHGFQENINHFCYIFSRFSGWGRDHDVANDFTMQTTLPFVSFWRSRIRKKKKKNV